MQLRARELETAAEEGTRTARIVQVVHELDEPDQACPSRGGDLEPMAGHFEEADEIDVVERSPSRANSNRPNPERIRGLALRP